MFVVMTACQCLCTMQTRCHASDSGELSASDFGISGSDAVVVLLDESERFQTAAWVSKPPRFSSQIPEKFKLDRTSRKGQLIRRIRSGKYTLEVNYSCEGYSRDMKHFSGRGGSGWTETTKVAEGVLTETFEVSERQAAVYVLSGGSWDGYSKQYMPPTLARRLRRPVIADDLSSQPVVPPEVVIFGRHRTSSPYGGYQGNVIYQAAFLD